MNLQKPINRIVNDVWQLAPVLSASALFGVSCMSSAAESNGASKTRLAAPCSAIQMADVATITLGKSTLIRLPTPAIRLFVGGFAGHAGKLDGDESLSNQAPNQALSVVSALKEGQTTTLKTSSERYKTGVADVDVSLLTPTEMLLLGKSVGGMNVIVQGANGQCTVMDVAVVMDSVSLQSRLRDLMPNEKSVTISAADDSLILLGEVSDAVQANMISTLAAAYAGEKRVINMLSISAPQQVMLEVKVAEISKTLLDRLGAQLNTGVSSGKTNLSVFSSFLSQGGGILDIARNSKYVTIDGEKQDGVVRILAEPVIMAISGQRASFLSGGKIFIPVSQSNANGVPVITLEEKEFGVGLSFTPTVLGNGRINLKVTPEVSELSQTGSPFTTTGGVTAVLPSFTTRRADTTVQLNDGQSFAIAGLVKNNLTETVKKFPVLSEIPILGALFRSSEFQKDLTELLFVITPRLVKPLPANHALPTDNFIEPTRSEFFLEGKMEGRAPVKPQKKPAEQPRAATPAPQQPAATSTGGFEVK